MTDIFCDSFIHPFCECNALAAETHMDILHPMDPRATRLAAVMIDHSLEVRQGDRLLLCASDLTTMDLLHECYRLGIERGAEVELDIIAMQLHRGRSDAGGLLKTFLTCASQEQLTHTPELALHKLEWANKFLFIVSIHDELFLAGIDPARIDAWRSPRFVLLEKILDTNKEWVLTQFPTESTAKNAGMDLEKCIDFFYDSCLIDYPQEAKRLQALQDILDAGDRVRVVAPGTDLTLGIHDRLAAGTNLGRRNVPDGECFVGPEEDITQGIITFELPQVREGNEVGGIRLEFAGGSVVSHSAQTGSGYLQRVLDDHPGNRRIGELGIGMNRNIRRYMRCTLFDEKIAGTVHFALGRSYDDPRGGGKNKGTIHWDLVKDLRSPRTLVTVDGRAIIRDGEVLV